MSRLPRSVTMKPITRLQPEARYCNASVYNGIVYVAGQIPEDGTQDLTGQTQQVLAASTNPTG